MKFVAVIPSYRHSLRVPSIVVELRRRQIDVLIVDDGNNEPERSELTALHDPADGVRVVRNERNMGKGGAVLGGLSKANELGFTHAIQIDADGQHDLNAIDSMLAASKRHPDALIVGIPIYDESIPKGRLIARWITHVWVWIETLSTSLTDTLCGFRTYPIVPTLALSREEHIGMRMDFDTEILVRLVWRGVRVAQVPVRVTYPEDNTSNFRMWADNILITRMHSRLFFGMLSRFFTVYRSRKNLVIRDEAVNAGHWASLSERGAYVGLVFLAWILNTFGVATCRFAMRPIIFYFWATGLRQRAASREFLTRALGRKARIADTYRHYLSFGNRTLDAFAAWIGRAQAPAFDYLNPSELQAARSDGRGAIIVVSHLGNVELLRAYMDDDLRGRMTVLIHSRHAARFNKILTRMQPRAAMNTLEVTDIGPETLVDLTDRISAGGWIVVAGDRVPVGGGSRISKLDFLGAKAPFPQGPLLLAGMLKCPVYSLFCLKTSADQYAVSFRPVVEHINLRGGRDKTLAVQTGVETYVSQLEELCRLYPYNWYNFFDFWGQHSE